MVFFIKKKARRKKTLQRSIFCEGDFNPRKYFIYWLGNFCYTSFIKHVYDRLLLLF